MAERRLRTILLHLQPSSSCGNIASDVSASSMSAIALLSPFSNDAFPCATRSADECFSCNSCGCSSTHTCDGNGVESSSSSSSSSSSADNYFRGVRVSGRCGVLDCREESAFFSKEDHLHPFEREFRGQVEENSSLDCVPGLVSNRVSLEFCRGESLEDRIDDLKRKDGKVEDSIVLDARRFQKDALELNVGTNSTAVIEKDGRDTEIKSVVAEDRGFAKQAAEDRGRESGEGIGESIPAGGNSNSRVPAPDKGLGFVRAGIASVTTFSKSNSLQGMGNSRAHDQGSSKGHFTQSQFHSGMSENCVFCEIVHGLAPAYKLYEDEACLCILDSHPVCFGHSLLLPKAHFPSLEVTPPQIAAAMCAAVPLISTALMEATHSDSFNMLVNSGVAAGQVIFHTHFHIIPRSSGDGLWKSESMRRRPLRAVQEAKILAHVVRTKLSSASTHQ